MLDLMCCSSRSIPSVAPFFFHLRRQHPSSQCRRCLLLFVVVVVPIIILSVVIGVVFLVVTVVVTVMLMLMLMLVNLDGCSVCIYQIMFIMFSIFIIT